MEMARLLTQLLRRPAPASDGGARIPFDVSSARKSERSFTRELKQLRTSAHDLAPARRPEPVKRPEEPSPSPSDEAAAPRDEATTPESTHVEVRQGAEAPIAGTLQIAVALTDPVGGDPEHTNAAPIEVEAAGAAAVQANVAEARSATAPWKASSSSADKAVLQATVDVKKPAQPEFKPQDHAIPLGKLAVDDPELELAEKVKQATSQETGRAGWAGRRFVADTSARHPSHIKNQGSGVTTASPNSNGGQAPGALSATIGRAEEVIKAVAAVQTNEAESGGVAYTATGSASARESAEHGAVAQRQAVAKAKVLSSAGVDRASEAPASGVGASSVGGGASPSSTGSASVGAEPWSRAALERVSVSRVEGDSGAASLAKALLASHGGDSSGNSWAAGTTGSEAHAGTSVLNVTSSGERGSAPPAKAFGALLGQQSPAATRVAELLLAQQPASSGVDAAVRLLGGSNGAGKQEVTLQLDPPELGRMRLEVRMEEQTMSLRVDVQSRAVAKLVETRLPELRDALSAHGISIDKSQVIIRTADAHGGSLGRESDSSANQQPGGHPGGSEGFFSEGQSGRDGGAGHSWRDGWTPAETTGSGDEAWSAAREAVQGDEASGINAGSAVSARAGAMNLVA